MHGIDIGRKLSIDEYDFLRTRGFRFTARYYDGTQGASSKCLDTTEVAIALSRGFGIVPVFETTGAGPWDYATGFAHGQAARTDALSCGQPLGSPIPFAVDMDVTSDPSGLLVPYFNGVYGGLDGAYLPGVYGEYLVCKAARESWPALGFFWQTYAWSGGVEYAPADVYQHANGVVLRPGLEVDLNIARSPITWRLA